MDRIKDIILQGVHYEPGTKILKVSDELEKTILVHRFIPIQKDALLGSGHIDVQLFESRNNGECSFSVAIKTKYQTDMLEDNLTGQEAKDILSLIKGLVRIAKIHTKLITIDSFKPSTSLNMLWNWLEELTSRRYPHA